MKKKYKETYSKQKKKTFYRNIMLMLSLFTLFILKCSINEGADTCNDIFLFFLFLMYDNMFEH